MSSLLLLLNWFYQFMYARLFVHLFQYLHTTLLPASISTPNSNSHHRPISSPIESSRYENIISLTCSYAWQVMTKNIDVDYPDVKRKVLNSTLVKRTIEKISQNEYQLLLNKSDNVSLNDRQNQQSTKNVIETSSDRNNIQHDKLGKLIRKNQQKALEHFMQMQSSISSSLLRIASWILYRLLSRIFTSIQFNKVQIGRIRDRIEQINRDGSSPNIAPVPTLYLPVYRSHLDSILVSFILSMNNLSPPLVAIDEHLSVPFFGNLMRGLGAFFLKSSQNDSANQKNEPDDLQLYNAVLRSYIIENLSVGNSLELFLVDPNDNSNGKSLASVPKDNHLLSIVMDALADGSVQQVNVVPVSISYEKSIDDPLVSASNGSMVTDNNINRNRQPAKPETFVSTFRIIWSTLRSNYGTVRVDFGKPFLLKDYANQIVSQKELFEHCQTTLFDEINDGNKRLDANVNQENSKQSLETSVHPIKKNNDCDSQMAADKNCVACGYNFVPTKASFSSLNADTGEKDITKEDRKEELDEGDGGGTVGKPGSDQFDRLKQICIDLLVKHVRLDVDRDSALMSTHLVSFILLNKYRKKGTTIDQLSVDIDWLRQTICRDKQLNLSVLGDSHSLIRQAIDLMGKKLIITENVRLKWSSWNNGNPYNNYTNDSRWSNNQFVDSQSSNGGYFSLTNNGPKNMRNSQQDSFSQQRYVNKNSARIEIIYLKPANNCNSILCLQQYSNRCAKIFKYESVIAMSLFSFVNTELSALIYDPSTFVSNLSINKNEFVQRCRKICSILQHEIIFTKSCQSWDQMLEKTFENSFVKQDVFVLNPNKPTGITLPMSDVNHSQYHHHNHSQTILNSNHCQNQKQHNSTIIRNRRRSSSAHLKRCILKPMEGSLQNQCILEVDENDLDNLDDDEPNTPTNEFYIRLTEKNKQLLALYCSILEPYMQAYFLIGQKLSETVADHNHRHIHDKSTMDTDSGLSASKLQTAIINEKSFLDQIMRISLTMANNGIILYESTSLQTFKNAIKYFLLIGAIHRKRRKQEETNNMKNSSQHYYDGKNKSSSIEGSVGHVSAAAITKEYSQQQNLSTAASTTTTTTTTTLLSCTIEQRQILMKLVDTMKAFVRVCPKNNKQHHPKH